MLLQPFQISALPLYILRTYYSNLLCPYILPPRNLKVIFRCNILISIQCQDILGWHSKMSWGCTPRPQRPGLNNQLCKSMEAAEVHRMRRVAAEKSWVEIGHSEAYFVGYVLYILYPIGSMVLLYIYGNMDPINIPPMLVYIPAPWILWVLYNIIIIKTWLAEVLRDRKGHHHQKD